MESVQAALLQAAVRTLASEVTSGRVSTETSFGALRCAEADALARVLMRGGESSAARDVIVSHAHASRSAGRRGCVDEPGNGDWHMKIARALVKGNHPKAMRQAEKYVAGLA